MRFIKFPEADTIIGKGQKQFKPLPAKYEHHNRGRVVMVAELNDEDFEKIQNDRKVYIELLTYQKPMQPIRISAFPPDDISNGKIQLRVNYNGDSPKPDHTGHYIIKGYLPAKSTVVRKPDGTQSKAMSWQQIHKTTVRLEHIGKLKELLGSGEYEMEKPL